MRTLVKTRRVYEMDGASDRGIRFVQRDEDTEKVTTRISIEKSAWIDMGAPYEITVTIGPGDLLNDAAGR